MSDRQRCTNTTLNPNVTFQTKKFKSWYMVNVTWGQSFDPIDSFEWYVIMWRVWPVISLLIWSKSYFSSSITWIKSKKYFWSESNLNGIPSQWRQNVTSWRHKDGSPSTLNAYEFTAQKIIPWSSGSFLLTLWLLIIIKLKE